MTRAQRRSHKQHIQKRKAIMVAASYKKKPGDGYFVLWLGGVPQDGKYSRKL